MNDIRGKYKLNWMERSFISSFPKRIKCLDKSDLAEMKMRFIEIFNSESKLLSDRQSQTHFIMCSYVLSGYKVLIEKGFSSEESIQVLTNSFKKFGSSFIIWSMKIMLTLRLYTRKYIESKSLKDAVSRYGDTFDIDEEKSAHQYTMIIKKCGFNDFFIRNSAKELTRIFCEWDYLWSDEINKNKKCGIQFMRPTTLVKNEEDCRFEFHFEKK